VHKKKKMRIIKRDPAKSDNYSIMSLITLLHFQTNKKCVIDPRESHQIKKILSYLIQRKEIMKIFYSLIQNSRQNQNLNVH